MQLQDKVIIVTGGGQGPRPRHGRAPGRQGRTPGSGGLNQDRLDEAVAACKIAGGEARAYLCNVASEEQVCRRSRASPRTSVACMGWSTMPASCATACCSRSGWRNQQDEPGQWQAVIDVNLTGVFLCTREVAAKMVELKSRRRDHQHLVDLRAGNMGQTNYSAAGRCRLGRGLGRELARAIRVAGVAPGFIETEMVASMKPEALEKMTAGIPLKRMGAGGDRPLGRLHLRNDYYTGRILELDGGLRL